MATIRLQQDRTLALGPVNFKMGLEQISGLERKLEELQNLVPFGSHSAADDGTYLSVNNLELAWLGLPREAVVGHKKLQDFLGRESQEKLARLINRIGLRGLHDVALDLVNAHGAIRAVSLSFAAHNAPVYEPVESVNRFVLFDMTEHNRNVERQRVRALAFESLAGACVTDSDGTILQINAAFTLLTGYAPEDIKGKSMRLLSSGYHDKAYFQEMWQAINSKGYWQGEICNRRKDGEIYAQWLSISATTRSDGSVSNYVGTFFDISASKANQAEIRHLAFYDALTQLPNRRLLEDRLAHVLSLAKRSGKCGALLFIDLDNFKAINDTRGHASGDKVLIETASRLRQCVREGDTVARVGGDEFVVILDSLHTDALEAAALARVIAEKVLIHLSQPYHLTGFDFSSTASIGISICDGNEAAAELLRQADIAMYQAKGLGRNTLVLFSAALNLAATTRASLLLDLSRAVAKKQLELYYQPQLNEHAQIIGAEALLRWNHPSLGMVSPVDFIPIAEESGLIISIGSWVLETACQQLQRWSTNPLTQHLRLAVNVSARQFFHADFADQVKGLIERLDINAQKLELEITESMVLDISDTQTKMKALDHIGVGFSMDDFGTGFSSLSSLTKLKLRQLKIDRCFVRNMEMTQSDAVVVQTIVAMATSLGLEVIAEGVENESQRAMLAQLGCKLYQGFLFSPAVDLDSFENLLTP